MLDGHALDRPVAFDGEAFDNALVLGGHALHRPVALDDHRIGVDHPLAQLVTRLPHCHETLVRLLDVCQPLLGCSKFVAQGQTAAEIGENRLRQTPTQARPTLCDRKKMHRRFGPDEQHAEPVHMGEFDTRIACLQLVPEFPYPKISLAHVDVVE